jgi:hypothetical protein
MQNIEEEWTSWPGGTKESVLSNWEIVQLMSTLLVSSKQCLNAMTLLLA